MSLLGLPLAGQAPGAAPAVVPPLALLRAFRTYCHDRRGDRQATPSVEGRRSDSVPAPLDYARDERKLGSAR